MIRSSHARMFVPGSYRAKLRNARSSVSWSKILSGLFLSRQTQRHPVQSMQVRRHLTGERCRLRLARCQCR